MTIVMPLRVTCPNCKAKFEVNALMSTNFRGMTTDLRQATRGGDPWHFMVHSCLKCGFTGEVADFRRKKVGAALSEKISREIRPRLRGEQPSAEVRWEFAAMIAEWRKRRDPRAIAEMYRNAAWCARDTEQEPYYRRKAAKWLELALETGVPDRPLVTYLIGEIYRRCGEKSLADTWFDAAIQEATSPDADWLRKLAIQQKTNPQQFFSEAL